MPWRAAFTALTGLVYLAGACSSDKKDHVAKLAEVLSGEVQKQIGSESWKPASKGQAFHDGDSVKTSDDGGARIAFAIGGGLKMGPNTIIRFGKGTLDEVEGEIQPIGADFEFGDMNIKDGSTVVLRKEGDSIVVDVAFGSVTVTRDGETLTFGKDESFQLDVVFKNLVIDKGDRPPDAGVADAGPPDAAPIDPTATVAAVISGRGARIKRSEDAEWERLPPGDHQLETGWQLRLRRRNKVTLDRSGENATVSGAATFTIGAPGSALLEPQRGSVVINATTVPVRVKLPGGSVTANPGKGSGSSASLDVGRSKTNIRSRGGTTDVAGDRGGRERIQIGEWISLSRSGQIEIFGRAPSFAHFDVTAGGSATIHDPAAPTNIRFRFADHCSSAGIVELSSGRGFSASARVSKGTGSAILKVRPGSYRYRVRCIDDGSLSGKAAAAGRIRLNRGAGTKRIPARPVTNTVDADGRKWNVLYQNLVPHIRFRWAAAPETGDYTLHVQSDRGATQTFKTSSRIHRVRSGKLREGEYTYWYTGNGSRSKKSRLRIAFDNAARSGYIKSPKVRQKWNGGQLKVEGATISGGTVSIKGTTLPLDSQHRFETSVSVAGQRAIAIKFSHPKTGTHYYIRRNGGR